MSTKRSPQEDTWTFQEVGTPFPPQAVKAMGQSNTYVALCYKHGKPYMGMAWNDSGVVQCSFVTNNVVQTGKEVGGTIQLLTYSQTHNEVGFYYDWLPFAKWKQEEGNDCFAVRCGQSIPVFLSDKQPLGHYDIDEQKAYMQLGQKNFETIAESNPLIQKLFVLCRITKGGPPHCPCFICSQNKVKSQSNRQILKPRRSSTKVAPQRNSVSPAARSPSMPNDAAQESRECGDPPDLVTGREASDSSSSTSSDSDRATRRSHSCVPVTAKHSDSWETLKKAMRKLAGLSKDLIETSTREPNDAFLDRPPLMVNDWADFKEGDRLPIDKPVCRALGRMLKTPLGQQDQYVALWYRHGKPVMGRAWSQNGIIRASFVEAGREFTGATVGSLQLLIELPAHAAGFDYTWLPYEQASRHDLKDYAPVHMCHMAPCVMLANGFELLGGINLKMEVAEAAINGKVIKFEGGQLKNFMILCRKDRDDTMSI